MKDDEDTLVKNKGFWSAIFWGALVSIAVGCGLAFGVGWGVLVFGLELLALVVIFVAAAQ